MYRFIHIGLMFPGIPKVNDLEPVFHSMGDEWIRYSQCSWIMWTDKNLVDVYDRLVGSVSVALQCFKRN